jgi:hypothetical protein
MLDITRESGLSEPLQNLEVCLEAPVVPGELPQWCAAAHAACAAVRQPLKTAIAQTHAATYRDILREDPGLASRVDAMRDEDRLLVARLDELQSLLRTLCPAAEAVEPDEARLDVSVEQATDAGLEFVIAVRKQEAALTTWLLEALERDRGVVD